MSCAPPRLPRGQDLAALTSKHVRPRCRRSATTNQSGLQRVLLRRVRLSRQRAAPSCHHPARGARMVKAHPSARSWFPSPREGHPYGCRAGHPVSSAASLADRSHTVRVTARARSSLAAGFAGGMGASRLASTSPRVLHAMQGKNPPRIAPASVFFLSPSRVKLRRCAPLTEQAAERKTLPFLSRVSAEKCISPSGR